MTIKILGWKHMADCHEWEYITHNLRPAYITLSDEDFDETFKYALKVNRECKKELENGKDI